MVETRADVQPAKTGPTERPTGRPGRIPESGALPTLKTVERTLGRPATIRRPVEGLIYRGRLVGYVRGDNGRRYAIVDTGHELAAFRTETADLTPGRDVRVTTHQAEADRRRGLLWRLGDDERQQERERA